MAYRVLVSQDFEQQFWLLSNCQYTWLILSSSHKNWCNNKLLWISNHTWLTLTSSHTILMNGHRHYNEANELLSERNTASGACDSSLKHDNCLFWKAKKHNLLHMLSSVTVTIVNNTNAFSRNYKLHSMRHPNNNIHLQNQDESETNNKLGEGLYLHG